MLSNYPKTASATEASDRRLASPTFHGIIKLLIDNVTLKSSLTIPTRRGAVFTQLVLDGIIAITVWIVFYRYRFDLLHKDFFWNLQYLGWTDVILGLFIIPFAWCFLYYVSGTYFDLYRKSRYDEIKRTLGSCLIGTVIIALVAFSNDATDFEYFSKSTGRYILLHTFFTLLIRVLYLSMIHANIVKGKVKFNTLIIGGNQNAINIYQKILSGNSHNSNHFKGFVYSSLESSNGMSKYLRQLGTIDELEKIIDDNSIEDVIVAVDSDEHNLLEKILLQLSYRPVYIKILPDLYDIISGSVKVNSIFDDTLFMHISPRLMPDWQKVCKRMIDIFASLFALIMLSPIYIFSSIKVLLSSPGPIVYRQERVGLYGNIFKIYKFRSMVIDAEAAGPSLSSTGDPRITNWGRIMRKYRIDELPQFFNVLKGDMSLVGPRPERQYFINIISETHPQYKYLHKVRPGLTSWGMVKYGYAENVSQMVERMKFDILYIENCSLVLDFRIILHTILTVIKGSGK
ncbi:sugar transferase [Dyadobacter diqingensis]|uniref:sugar transferase n=1 Tax=Dyadobacter diqingensis TaxID=2938121 RepID=UPI0020C1B493|nr:sugar transferase [Dyadobacter diqingensis]